MFDIDDDFHDMNCVCKDCQFEMEMAHEMGLSDSDF